MGIPANRAVEKRAQWLPVGAIHRTGTSIETSSTRNQRFSNAGVVKVTSKRSGLRS